MTLVAANKSFDWAGLQVRVGDVLDSSHVLVVTFPSRFTSESVGSTYSADETTLHLSGSTFSVLAVPESIVTNLVADLAATEKSANKNANSGYMGLDSSGVGQKPPQLHASRHIATDKLIVADTLANRPAASAATAPWYFATDDAGGTLYFSDGTNWNQATKRGELGYAQITSNFGLTMSFADVTGLTTTVTVSYPTLGLRGDR